MAVTVAEVMRECNNFFEEDIFSEEAKYTISADGSITPSIAGNYVAIHGSDCHDGVFPVANGKIVFDGTPDAETFVGTVWNLHVPSQFIAICDEISAYSDKNPVSGMTSESFAGYSYTRNSASDTWQKAFRRKLLPYYRMFTEVNV